MKKIKKYIHVVLIALGVMVNCACEDLAFGNKFLQKPPSSDVTIDTVFSTAEYARRVLWYSYQYLPYGLEVSNHSTTLYLGNLEGLTDLNNDNIGYSGVQKVYYDGKYTAKTENTRTNFQQQTKIRFNEADTHMWSAIRHAWLLVANIDRVPDMSADEKARLKAEAKMMVAVYYAHMIRHYGAVPIVDHAFDASDEMPGRATLQETVDFTIHLLDEAIAEPNFPWTLPADEKSQMDGRLCKAGAYALKTRLLLFVASPLFNSDKPYAEGEAAEKKMVWFGNYDKNRWKLAMDAGKAFFDALKTNGYYHLVQKEEVTPSDYRYAFRAAYFDRGTTETLISVRRDIFTINMSTPEGQAMRWGGYCPTKEYFDMFPMANGEDFDWNNPEMAKNPFINRDPRLTETFVLDGDIFVGRKANVTEKMPAATAKKLGVNAADYPAGSDFGKGNMHTLSMFSGMGCRKWGLDRNTELKNHPIQWPHIRLAEVYLNYAEAINEYNGGPNDEAYNCIDAVRERVGLGKLKRGMSQSEFRAALLRERACEFGYEEVRFFDLIRWKMEEKFTTPVHGMHIYKNKKDGTYKCVPFSLATTNRKRAWWNPGGFSPIWYLSAFPKNEVQKGYGLVQNPGWE